MLNLVDSSSEGELAGVHWWNSSENYAIQSFDDRSREQHTMEVTQPAATQPTVPSPGSRVVIRDEEWLVLRTDPTSDGGFLLTCDGVSDLVRGRSALFLSALEREIEVLDPAKTVLVPDTSRTYNDSLLYLESNRRRSIPNDELIHLGHRGVMNLVPYQLDPALQALKQPRTRILIADAVGLGKTLEAGILATEFIQRGRGKRILVVTSKEHAHSVSERMVEPFLHTPGPARLGGSCPRSQPDPGESQPVQLFRSQYHFDRHTQEQPRVPQLPRKCLVGHHRHRRVPERGSTSGEERRVAPCAARSRCWQRAPTR